MQCRYCLSDELVGDSDKFVDPCNCQGSLRYVHQKCLYQWISKSGKQSDLVLVGSSDSSRLREENFENFDNFDNFENSANLYGIKCEICTYEMKCYQIYQLSIIASLLSTSKNFLFDFKKYPICLFHFSVLYFVYYQFQSIVLCIFEIFYIQIGRKILTDLIYDLSLLTLNIWFGGGIFKFYQNKFLEQRGTIFKFLPKIKIERPNLNFL